MLMKHAKAPWFCLHVLKENDVYPPPHLQTNVLRKHLEQNERKTQISNGAVKVPGVLSTSRPVEREM